MKGKTVKQRQIGDKKGARGGLQENMY
jgi:hypothetical protein